jgi:hypothetical protein
MLRLQVKKNYITIFLRGKDKLRNDQNFFIWE